MPDREVTRRVATHTPFRHAMSADASFAAMSEVMGEADAVVVAPSGSAVPALAAASRAGRTVGKDLLLAAYVDEPLHALLTPTVTALDLQPRDVGAACLEVLAGDAADRFRVHRPLLRARASTRAAGAVTGTNTETARS